jgi:hypothetical protein
VVQHRALSLPFEIKRACHARPQEMNLRDLTRKVGRNKGLAVEAVQLFACQLLIALRHMKKQNVSAAMCLGLCGVGTQSFLLLLLQVFFA